MNRNQALTLLGSDDKLTQDELMERLDAEAFAVRDHFLRQPVVPTLYRSRVDRLVQLSDVSNALGIDPLGAPVDLPALVPLEGPPVAHVRAHVENILRLRTAMAATLDPDVLARFGNAMTTLQIQYMTWFIGEFSDQYPAPSSNAETLSVPARDEADWQQLMAAVAALDFEKGGLLQRELTRMQVVMNRELTR